MTIRIGADDNAGSPATPDSLPSVEGAPLRLDRLFFALLPDPAAVQRIERLAAELRERRGLRGKPLATDRFHVTLHHLGDFAGIPPAVEAAACAAAASVVAGPFELSFDRIACFSRKADKKPVVLRATEPATDLMAFQRTLGVALKNAGFGVSTVRGFTPHLTLMYDPNGLGSEAVEPVRWTAREFVLVHSLIGKSVHRHRARWPLLEG